MNTDFKKLSEEDEEKLSNSLGSSKSRSIIFFGVLFLGTIVNVYFNQNLINLLLSEMVFLFFLWNIYAQSGLIEKDLKEKNKVCFNIKVESVSKTSKTIFFEKENDMLKYIDWNCAKNVDQKIFEKINEGDLVSVEIVFNSKTLLHSSLGDNAVFEIYEHGTFELKIN